MSQGIICTKIPSIFGCIYDTNGIRPDPAKVKAVNDMPAPKSNTDLQRFLGLVMYNNTFTPGVSAMTQCLRRLLKKDVDFEWNSSSLLLVFFPL